MYNANTFQIVLEVFFCLASLREKLLVVDAESGTFKFILDWGMWHTSSLWLVGVQMGHMLLVVRAWKVTK